MDGERQRESVVVVSVLSDEVDSTRRLPDTRPLLLDLRSGDVQPVPLEATLPIVVVDTRVRHDMLSGAYAQRRRDCEAAAVSLALPNLRDATVEAVETRLAVPRAARA